MKNRKKWKHEYGILIILIAIFSFLFMWSGVQEFPDTITYVDMYFGRDPVYPLLLAGLRGILGVNFYYYVVILLQNMLAIAAIFLLVKKTTKIFYLNNIESYMMALLALSPYLLSPLGTASRMTLTNGIITESISVSLYYILVALLLQIIFRENILRNSVLSFILTLLIVLTRGSMLPLLLVWMLVTGFICIRYKMYRYIFLIIVITGIGFGMRSGLVRVYNQVLFHVDAVSNNANTTFFTNVIYSADIDDGKNIKNSMLQNSYNEMVNAVKEKGLHAEQAEQGLINKIEHHENSHDKIKFEIAELYITWYVNDATDFAHIGYEREVLKEQAAKELTAAVLPNSFHAWIENYFVIAAGGFIRTVAVLQPGMNWYAIFIYSSAFLLMFFLFWKDRKSKAALFMLFVFLLICENVFATSVTIMCLSRYMIYNISLFYMGGILMLRELWKHSNCRKKSGE